MSAQMDPFLPTCGHEGVEADVLLAPLSPRAVEELQGPAKDGRTTARDSDGRLLARYSGKWAEVPSPSQASIRIGLQPGLVLKSCWGELVRPALHQALRHHQAAAVHGAAVDLGTTGGALVCGWSESGKTEVALALVEAGANFLSDKWTVAGEDGQISAFPVGVGVRGWVLEALPRLRAGLPRRARAQLLAARAARVAIRPAVERSGRGRLATRGVEAAERVVDLGDRAALSPSELRRAYGHTADAARRAELETVVVLVTGTQDKVVVEDAAPEWAAHRLALTAAYERRDYYNLQERGAYADLRGRAQARAESVDAEEQILIRALAKAVRVLRVTCPFPGDPRRVVDALASHL